jgi:hypothetical protein
VPEPGERGDGQFRAQGGQAGAVPGPAVDRFTEYVAVGAAEQPPVRRGAVFVQAMKQHGGQEGRTGWRGWCCRGGA